jgi:serine/threonine protein kinase
MSAFACPRCGRSIEIDASAPPQQALCPYCGEATPAPKPDSATLALESSDATPQEFIPTVAGDHAKLAIRNELPPHILTPPEAADELGRLAGYRVLKLLGTGGMGIVLQAEDPSLHRMVAIKVLRPELNVRPEFVMRFLREARMLASLNENDHVVAIHRVGQDRDVPYLVMELLEGESLRTRLDRDKVLPINLVVRIGREVAEGLAAAHARGLIHRDIKPGNIWLEHRGSAPDQPRAKILDFGLAHDADQSTQLTRTGTVVGSPAYLAPEQARGIKVDTRCDIFSLGCVLYRACTGRAPFPGEDTLAILSSLATITPPPPRSLNPKVPRALSDLISRLLAKDRDRRPATAEVVAQELRAIEATLDGSVEVPGSPAGMSSAIRPVSLIAGVLAFVGIAAYLILHQPESPTPPPTADASKVPDEKGNGEVKKEPAKPPIDDAWINATAALPPNDQAEAVAAKLKELNPGFDGNCKHQVLQGVVYHFDFNSENVKDIRPLAALKGLAILSCNAVVSASDLSDFSPLRGHRLRILECANTRLEDLKPLQGMPLERVMFAGTQVKDLSPLEGARIHSLDLSRTRVADLRPLRNMPVQWLLLSRSAVADLSPLATNRTLSYLQLERTNVTDLTPLRDTSVEDLDCNFTRLANLEPVKGMKKLRRLGIMTTFVTDLSPLRGTMIEDLYLQGTEITDMSPLKDMPHLKEVAGPFVPARDASILKSIPTLKTINYRPADEFK